MARKRKDPLKVSPIVTPDPTGEGIDKESNKMDQKKLYRVYQAFYDGHRVGVRRLVIGGDFMDITGILRGELMNCDYPSLVVLRVDVVGQAPPFYQVRCQGTLPHAMCSLLELKAEVLWYRLDEFCKD